MRISIGMCTYNGERFLREQLASFVGQTRLPDELVVCDDRSKDGTWKILEEFRADAPFDVTLVQNETNLGSTANCEKALSLCTGDVLLPSDQDDAWLPGKLEAIERAFAANPGASVVIGDVVVVDARLRPLGWTLWEAHGFDAARQDKMRADPVGTLLERNHATAGGMAFRAERRAEAFPCSRLWIHDGWIALMAAMKGDVVIVPETMMLYRQHGSNQVGGARATRWQQLRTNLRDHTRDMRATYRKDHAYWNAALERLAAISTDDPVRRAAVEGLRERVAHLAARGDLPAARGARLAHVRAELRTGRYGRFSGGALSALKDLLL